MGLSSVCSARVTPCRTYGNAKLQRQPTSTRKQTRSALISWRIRRFLSVLGEALPSDLSGLTCDRLARYFSQSEIPLPVCASCFHSLGLSCPPLCLAVKLKPCKAKWTERRQKERILALKHQKKKKIGQSSHPSLICSISGKMSYFFSVQL